MTCREKVAQLDEQIARYASRIQQLYRQRAGLLTILRRIKDCPMPAKEALAIKKILEQPYSADELLIVARKQVLTPHGR